jgi:hypothetical protein
MRTELTWWVNNLRQQSRSINRSTPNTIIETDASFLGWGAKYKDIRTGGRWLVEEKLLNINVLELLAIFYALRSFREHVVSQHVKIMSDNTTAVSYINNMGGTVSLQCNKIAVEIWTWCIANDIWLTAAHIAGKENLEADQASRKFKDNLEWKLDEKIFNKICDLWGTPDLDCFASRLNAQLKNYCSWKPDPDCIYVDAFSIDWKIVNNVYVYPPFSLLGRCVQKMRRDMAKGIIIAPLWTTQPWFPRLMDILVDTPVIIQKKKGLLKLPLQQMSHPLEGRLRLIVCKVSGIVSENVDFQRTLPEYSCCHGNQVLKNSIIHTLPGGFATVLKGRLLQFRQLWRK